MYCKPILVIVDGDLYGLKYGREYREYVVYAV